MVTVICGTNRENSNSGVIAKFIHEYLSNSDVLSSYLSLEDFSGDFISGKMYDSNFVNEGLVGIQEKYIFPNNKWLIVAPEYNGSIPGILKLFIDAISVRKYASNFAGKKVGFIGVASGRGGNLRGMDEMTNFFHYLKVEVFPEKLPLSLIDSHLKNGNLKEETKELITDMTDRFIKW